MTDVSVIGLGDMGSALAATLLDSGYAVTLWNRSADKAAPLIAAGAQLAESAQDAIAVCVDVISQTIRVVVQNGR